MQEDRPWRIPQVSTARGRDEGRPQSGGVKGVIVPASDPGMAEPGDDLTGRFLSCAARALVLLSTYLTCFNSIFTFFHRLFDVLFYFFCLHPEYHLRRPCVLTGGKL